MTAPKPANDLFTPPGVSSVAFTAAFAGIHTLAPVEALGTAQNFLLWRQNDSISTAPANGCLTCYLAEGQSVRYFSPVAFHLAVVRLGDELFEE